MDFSLRRVGQENLHYYESEQDSQIQLVFLPGAFNPEIWKHQLNYFSRKHRTVSFQPTKSFRDLEGERRGLENILNQEKIENAVLVSNIWSNSLAQEFEDHENVVATVFTGVTKKPELRRRALYNSFWKLVKSKPKLLKKSVFCDETRYSIVKEFVNDLEVPDYSDLLSFQRDYNFSRPSKASLIIHAEEDRKSSIELARELRDSASISIIERAGTFSYYEKPQEYNKALSDFLSRVEESVEEKELIETKNKNRSLFEFEKKLEGNKKPKKVVTGK